MNEMKHKLFLDDHREAWDDTWEVVKDYKNFKEYITTYYKKYKKVPSVVSFDHDLHEEHYKNEMYSDNAADYNRFYAKFIHNTGLDCAKWMCQFCVDEGIELPKVNVHSANPIGASNIASEVMNYSLFYYEEDIHIIPNPYDKGYEDKTF